MATKKKNKVQPGRLVDFSGGQNDAIDPDLLNDNESVLLQCATLDQKGTLMPDRGADDRFTSDFDAANPVIGIDAFNKSDETTRLVIGCGTKLYKDTPHVIKTFDIKADWDAGSTLCNIDTVSTSGSIKLVAKPTNAFTRATVAYNEDGTQVTSGTPRYKTGKFSNGVWIEEATTNTVLDPVFANADITVNWNNANKTDWSNASVLKDRDSTYKKYGTHSAKCGNGVGDGLGMAEKSQGTSAHAVSAGQNWTLGFDVYATDAAQYIACIRCYDSSGNNVSGTITPPSGWLYSSNYGALFFTGTPTTTGAWHRITKVFTVPTGVSYVAIGLMYYTNGTAKYIWFDGVQFEQKAYATSPIEGTRNADQLYYTLTNALPAEFFTCGFLKPDWANTISHSSYLMVYALHLDVNNRYFLYYDPAVDRYMLSENIAGSGRIPVQSSVQTFSAGNNLFFALALLSQSHGDLSAGWHLWIGNNGAAIEHYSGTSVGAASGINKVSLGYHPYTLVKEINGTEDAVQLIDVNALEAYGTTFNSTFVNNQYTAVSAPTSTPAHLLLTNLDSALDAADLTGGVWISAWKDVSQATDTASGVISWESTLPAGTSLAVKARSSANQTTVTAWTAESNGLTMNTAHNTYVQVANVFSRTDTAQNPSVEKTILSYDGTPAATELLTGLTAGGNVFMDTLSDTLMIVNGIDTPKKWDGSTASASDLGGSPPRGEYIATHKNRVFLLLKSRLWFSDVLNNESWPVLNFIDISPNDGDRGTGLLRSSDYLLIAKRRSIYILVGDSSTNFAVRRIQSDSGCLAPRSLCLVNELASFVGSDGVYFCDLATVTLASERIKTTWDGLNQRRLNQAASSYHDHILRIAVPNGASAHNNKILEFDTIRKAWKVRNDWKVSCWTKFREAGKEVLLYGDSQSGQVLEIDKGYANNGTGINFEWQSKHFHFGVPERVKRFRKLYLQVKPYTTDVPINIYFTVDGGTFSSSVTKTIPGRSDDKIETIVIRPATVGVLRGHSLGIKITQNTANAAVGIHSAQLEYMVKGARATI
ncbi:MAG: hypothetical protein ACYDG6_11270 [Thermincolia bacterium]